MIAPEVNRPAAPGIAPVLPVAPEPRIDERERRRQPQPGRTRRDHANDVARRGAGDEDDDGMPRVDEYA